MPPLLRSDDYVLGELNMKKVQIDSANTERLFEDAELREEKGDLAGAFKVIWLRLNSEISLASSLSGTFMPMVPEFQGAWRKQRDGTERHIVTECLPQQLIFLLSCRTWETYGELLHGSHEQ